MTQSKENAMQELIKRARQYGDEILRTNGFFKKLESGAHDDMRFVYQLRAWCGRFIDALFIAAASPRVSEQSPIKRMRRDHAVEEGRHPGQLDDWMRARGLIEQSCANQETAQLADFVRTVALIEGSEAQVLILNVLSEYLAKITFQAIIKHFGTDVMHGRYWHIHEEVDEEHSMMGTNLLKQEDVDRQQFFLSQMLERGAGLFSRMLESW